MARRRRHLGRSPSVRIGGEAAGPDVDEQLHRVRMAIFSGDHQRRPTVFHPRVNRRAEVGERVDHVRPADQRGQQKRGVEVLATVSGQLTHCGGTALAHGEHQRFEAIFILQTRIRALAQQPAHHLRLIAHHRRHQGRAFLRAAKVHRQTAIEQEIRRALRPGGRRRMQGGIPLRVPAVDRKFS